MSREGNSLLLLRVEKLKIDSVTGLRRLPAENGISAGFKINRVECI